MPFEPQQTYPSLQRCIRVLHLFQGGWELLATALLLLLLAAPSMASSAMGEAVLVIGKVERVELGKAGDAPRRTRVSRGEQIVVGSELHTAENGQIHIKAVDGAVLIVRPNSILQIHSYDYNPSAPEQSNIKIELKQGVVRSVSGKGAQAAKDHFRLDTPLITIGVRGTDFTVHTTLRRSLVAVTSGGVVMTSGDAGCLPGGASCNEQRAYRELFAANERLLEAVLKNGELQLFERLRSEVEALEPVVSPLVYVDEAVTPDESGVPVETESPLESVVPSEESKVAAEESKVAAEDETATAAVTDEPTVTVIDEDASVSLPQQETIVEVEESPQGTVLQEGEVVELEWGRWTTMSDEEIRQLAGEGREIVAINKQYLLTRSPWQSHHLLPERGVFDFTLQEYDARLVEQGVEIDQVDMENARLQIDFPQAAFTTTADLVPQSGGERYEMVGAGGITADGLLVGRRFFDVNSRVLGAISPLADEASYLFERKTAIDQSVVGVTRWVK